MTHRTLLPRVLALLLFAAPLLGAVACGAEGSGGVVEPAALEAELARPDGPLLLDVRTPEEYAEGHVPGARLIPVQELGSRLGEIEDAKQRGVITYCESGRRASAAAELLREAGFADVRVLDGSMARWRDEERPIER